MIHKSLAYFLAEITPWHWAIVRHHDANLADKIAKGMTENEIGNIVRDLRTHTSPASVSNAIEFYWMKLAQGLPVQAKDALLQCAQHGAPLPFDVE